MDGERRRKANAAKSRKRRRTGALGSMFGTIVLVVVVGTLAVAAVAPGGWLDWESQARSAPGSALGPNRRGFFGRFVRESAISDRPSKNRTSKWLPWGQAIPRVHRAFRPSRPVTREPSGPSGKQEKHVAACPSADNALYLLRLDVRSVCDEFSGGLEHWCGAYGLDERQAKPERCRGPDSGAALRPGDLAPRVPAGPERAAMMRLLRHAAAFGECVTDPEAEGDDVRCRGRRRIAVAGHAGGTGLGNYVVGTASLLLNTVALRRALVLAPGLPTRMLQPYFGSPMRALGMRGPAAEAGWYADCGAGSAVERPDGLFVRTEIDIRPGVRFPVAPLASAAWAVHRRCPRTAQGAAAVVESLPAPPLSRGIWHKLRALARYEAAAPLLKVSSGSAEASLGEGLCSWAREAGLADASRLHAIAIAALLSNPTHRMLRLARNYKARVGWDGYDVRMGLQIRACVDCGWTNEAWSPPGRLQEQLACARGVLEGLMRDRPARSRAVVFFTTDKPSIFDEVRLGMGRGVTVLGSGPDGRPPKWFHSMTGKAEDAKRDQLMLDIFMLGETDAVASTGTTFSRVGSGRTLAPLHILPYKDKPFCRPARPLIEPSCDGWDEAAAVRV